MGRISILCTSDVALQHPIPGSIIREVPGAKPGIEGPPIPPGEPSRLRVPIICVGNIVAGGAGKTPVARDLGARLCDKGNGLEHCRSLIWD